MVAGDDLLGMLREMKAARGPYSAGGMAASSSTLVDFGTARVDAS
jgi:hypothetical protein